MAQQQLGSIDINFVNSLKATPEFNSGVNADADTLFSYADTASIRTLRTSLNTYDPLTYPNSVLNVMNVNDLVFAWRQTSHALNAKTIADYMTQQAIRV